MLLVLAPPPPNLGLGQTISQVQQMIASAAAAYPGVPNLTEVATALATHESGLQAGAQNPSSSACGIFQLLSVTQETLGVTDCTNAQQNVDAAVPLLASYYQQYGNWADALQAFSDGPATVAAGTIPSTQTDQLISYIEGNTGLDLSGDSSSLSLSSLTSSLTTLGLPDLSGFSISDALGISGVPDWVTWLGIGLAGAAGVMLLTRG